MPPKPKDNQNLKTNSFMYVAGINNNNQINFESNNYNSKGLRIVCPPVRIPIKTANCLSFSAFCSHSVVIMNNEPSTTIGPFTGNSRIQTNKKRLKKWSRITIEDKHGNNYKPISAVCGLDYTLYLLNPLQKDDIPRLAYFKEGENNEDILFLDTENSVPIALFGGSNLSASIAEDGTIIIVDTLVFTTDNHRPQYLTLPEGEKPVQVAFLTKFVYILSSAGNVYELNKSQKNLEKVKSLDGYKIVQISGSKNHILAVTNDGKVLGHGQNRHGQLGIGHIMQSTKFEIVKSLSKLKITAAYAGSKHSLFQTSDGAVYACGSNSNGQLLFNEPSDEIFYDPKPTIITKGATFCIAGAGVSCVFTSSQLPSRMPNMKVKTFIKQPKSQKSDTQKIKEIFDIQSQIREMKSNFENKNNQIMQLKQENTSIIKNIDKILLKIDQYKPKKTAKPNKKGPSKKDQSNQSANLEAYKEDIIKSKASKNQQQKIDNTENQRREPHVFKKTSGPLLFRIDKNKPKENNSEDIISQKVIVSPKDEVEQNNYSSDSEEHYNEEKTKILPEDQEDNKKAENNYDDLDDNEDDKLDEQTNNNEAQNKQQNNENEYIEDDGSDDDFDDNDEIQNKSDDESYYNDHNTNIENDDESKEPYEKKSTEDKDEEVDNNEIDDETNVNVYLNNDESKDEVNDKGQDKNDNENEINNEDQATNEKDIANNDEIDNQNKDENDEIDNQNKDEIDEIDNQNKDEIDEIDNQNKDEKDDENETESQNEDENDNQIEDKNSSPENSDYERNYSSDDEN